MTAGEPVHGFGVLDAVLALPVSTWRYRWDPPGVRHLGPMAQDWWAAFGVGQNDRTICCTDANGVALVAIQALHRLLDEARQETAELRSRLDQLEKANPAAHADPPHPMPTLLATSTPARSTTASSTT